jgi:uncharacterized repeat protein (TIGR04052 family)
MKFLKSILSMLGPDRKAKIFKIFLMSGLMACGGNSSKTITAQSISIPFAARAGGLDIACDTQLQGLGTSGSQVFMKDFRFYVSGVSLIGSDGKSYPLSLDESEWQSGELALLDFQDRADNCEGETKSVHTRLTGTISNEASVRGIRFRVGIPAASNHIDLASARGPLNVASMYWSWQGGYKFMRLDVAPEGGITRPSNPDFSATVYNFHLGSTNCSGNPEGGEAVNCKRSNRPEIELGDFDPATDTIVLDYKALVDDLSLISDVKDTPGCMSETSDTECSVFFNKLGMDLASGQPTDSLQQTVFSVE